MPARACTGRGALGAYFAMEAQLARLASLGLVDATEHRDRNLMSCYSITRTWRDIAVTLLVWIGAVGRGALSGRLQMACRPVPEHCKRLKLNVHGRKTGGESTAYRYSTG